MTTVLPPARLRGLLGHDLAGLDLGCLRRLVGLREDEDFEVKSALYGNSDSDRRELALDVAALANARGGLLVLGAVEVDDVVTEICPLSVPDGELLRVRQILSSLITPYVEVDLRQVDGPDGSAVVLMVPRSAMAPHAVVVNQTFRYVIRSGAGRRPLSEAEVADRYRRRFEESRSRLERLQELINVVSGVPLQADHAWLVIASVPEQAGMLPLGHGSLSKFRAWLDETTPKLLLRGPLEGFHPEVTVGVRRLIATDYAGSEQAGAKYFHFEAHTDGSAAIAVPVGWLWTRGQGGLELPAGTPLVVGDERLAIQLLGGLQLLGSHAVRAGCFGFTSALASIEVRGDHPDGNPWTMRLGHNRGFFSDGIGRPRGAIERAAHTLPIESICTAGPELVSSASLVANDLVAAFGLAAAWQVGEDGSVRIRYFKQELHAALRSWCDAFGIIVSDETVSD